MQVNDKVLTNLEHGAAGSVKVLNAYYVDNYPEFDTNGNGSISV